MSELQQGPEETLNGVRTVRLSGALPGRVLGAFTPELNAVERVDVELWVGTDDSRIHQIVVREPLAAGATAQPVTWTFQFSRFDEPISIQPPA